MKLKIISDGTTASVGYGLMDPEAPPVASLDEELAAMTEGRGDA